MAFSAEKSGLRLGRFSFVGEGSWRRVSPFLIAQSFRGKILVLVESAAVLACFPVHDDVMDEG